MTVRKGALIFLVSNLVGFVIFLLSGHGAIVTCAPTPGELDCYLHKRSIWAAKEDKFTRAQVVSVQLTVSTHTSQHRKTTEDLWAIKLLDGQLLPVTLRGVSASLGNMTLGTLEQLLVEKNQAIAGQTLRVISYGLIAWILGLLCAFIGWTILIVALAKPVQNVSTSELSRARMQNLRMFVTITVATVGGWIWMLTRLGVWLAG